MIREMNKDHFMTTIEYYHSYKPRVDRLSGYAMENLWTAIADVAGRQERDRSTGLDCLCCAISKAAALQVLDMVEQGYRLVPSDSVVLTYGEALYAAWLLPHG